MKLKLRLGVLRIAHSQLLTSQKPLIPQMLVQRPISMSFNVDRDTYMIIGVDPEFDEIEIGAGFEVPEYDAVTNWPNGELGFVRRPETQSERATRIMHTEIHKICPRCHGHGKFGDEKRCFMCNGTGVPS